MMIVTMTIDDDNDNGDDDDIGDDDDSDDGDNDEDGENCCKVVPTPNLPARWSKSGEWPHYIANYIL